MTKALLDTGSTVSTICRTFYEDHLKHIPIQTLDEILNIECADGGFLPYDGMIEAKIKVSGLDDQDVKPLAGVFLIIPDSQYSASVPVLIGTNIMSVYMNRMKEKHGDRFLQLARLTTPWYTSFVSIAMRDREIDRRKGRLAVVKLAGSQCVTIKPNSEETICGYFDKQMPYPPVCALVQPTSRSCVPDDLDIAPTIVSYNYKDSGLVDIVISNVSTRTVTLQPKATLCEIQPVSVTDIAEQPAVEHSKDPLQEVKIHTDGLTEEELEQGRNLISKFSSIFSRNDHDIGHTDLVTHRIELENEVPFKQRFRRIPPAMFQEVRDHLQQLLASGVIRRSHSPWSSNVVLVRKKDGSLRMCVDYRQLNKITKKDAYALPRIEEILDSLAGNKYFTVLDMKSGYHQVGIEEAHKPRTAFTVGPLGFFEYTRMPFGLANSPATYQRLMEQILGDMHTQICFIYLDDVIIFAPTYEEHLRRLGLVLSRLQESGIKLSAKKCEFFQTKVKYVGHIVSEVGIEPDPSKIEKVKNWKTPLTPEEVRQFLGFVGYFRRFIKDFARIAKPLNALMPSPIQNKRCKTKRKPSEKRPWVWGKKEENAFEELKQRLMSPPILGYPNFDLPFELHVDASLLGLGAILYQDQGGHPRVIAYASRGLTRSELNYSAYKLEFLALKWAVCEKYRDYLNGQRFTVKTDNNPLTYVLSSAKLDATSHRWVAALASFNFDIIYRPGVKNKDADSMSRHPELKARAEELSKITSDNIKAICNSSGGVPYFESLPVDTSMLDATFNSCFATAVQEIDVQSEQRKDPDLHWWLLFVKNKRKPYKKDIPRSIYSKTLFRQFHLLSLEDEVLVRKTNVDAEENTQIVLPQACVPEVLKLLHDQMGHQGRDRTLALVRDRFYWYGMVRDVETYVKNCTRCILRKGDDNQRAPLVPISSSQPLELVCMDFLSLETSKGGYENILVITDHFTRYAMAVPTKNQTAKTTADAFFHNFVVHYGIPQRIHTDQGRNFESRLLQELCLLTGMKKSRTTSYHPMGNGACERMNRTLIGMLGTLSDEKKKDWRSYIDALVHSYNCTRQESTGHSPYFLMFGREPRLPVDLVFGVHREKSTESLTAYVEKLRTRMTKAYNLAEKAAEKAKERQKSIYDTKVRGAVPHVGDRVLVKIVAFDGKHKLSNKWEEDPYVILEQPNQNIPVFVVKKENGEGRKRTLHRNLLLPIGAIPIKEWTTDDNRPLSKPIPVPRRLPKISKEIDEESDEEDSMVVIEHSQPQEEIHTPSQTGTEEASPGGEETEHSSVNENDVVDENEGIGDDESNDDIVSQYEPSPPSRPVRAKKKPNWMTTGEYIMSQQTGSVRNDDWLVRAEYLKDLLEKVPVGKADDLYSAILKIVSEK